MLRSGKECITAGDSVHVTVSCVDVGEDDQICRRPVSAVTSGSRRKLSNFSYPTLINNDTNLTDLAGADGFDSGFVNVSGVIGNDTTSSPEPVCVEKNFQLTFTLTFDGSDDAANVPVKTITHFIKAKDGIQTDLFDLLQGETELAYGTPMIIQSTETMRLCSNDKDEKGLVAIDLENALFNTAFDDFAKDLTINDPNNEGECQDA